VEKVPLSLMPEMVYIYSDKDNNKKYDKKDKIHLFDLSSRRCFVSGP